MGIGENVGESTGQWTSTTGGTRSGMDYLELGTGTHDISQWLAGSYREKNLAIIGKGAGLTIISHTIYLDAWCPILRGLTIAPDEDANAGESALHLHNPGTVRIDNVELLSPRNGLGFEVTVDEPCYAKGQPVFRPVGPLLGVK